MPRPFTLFSLASLLLFLLTAAVWFTNIYHPNFFGRPTVALGNLAINGQRGETAFAWMHKDSVRETFWSLPLAAATLTLSQTCTWHFAGFGLDRPRAASFYFVIPNWFFLILTSIPPLLWLTRRLSPKPTGLCPTCGYDLRATPDRCPECGEQPAQVGKQT
jgi:hypothetical protein